MKTGTDILYANGNNRAQWGVFASANAFHIPFTGNVLFGCLLMLKFNLFCDSFFFSVVLISVCTFLF